MATPGSQQARPHRTWPERLAIAATVIAAVICFLAAGSLVAGYMVVRSRNVVSIVNPADEAAAATTTTTVAAPPPTAAPGATLGPTVPTTTPETFPPTDP